MANSDLEAIKITLSMLTNTINKIGKDMYDLANKGISVERPTISTSNIKTDLPRFDGKDVEGWLYKVNHYFRHHQVSDDQRIAWASMNMEGEALEWLLWIDQEGNLWSWGDFIDDIRKRFGQRPYALQIGRLSKLTSSVKDYQTKFEAMTTNVHRVSHQAMKEMNIVDLKPDIRQELQKTKLDDISEAFALSSMCDDTTDFTNNNTQNIAKNLCFNCDEKWSCGYKCKGKLFILSAEGTTMTEVIKQDEVDDDLRSEFTPTKLTQISLHALEGDLNQRIICVHGTVHNTPNLEILPKLLIKNQVIPLLIAFFNEHITLYNDIPKKEVSVQCDDLDLENTSWEKLSVLGEMILSLNLEDKVVLQGNGDVTRIIPNATKAIEFLKRNDPLESDWEEESKKEDWVNDEPSGLERLTNKDRQPHDCRNRQPSRFEDYNVNWNGNTFNHVFKSLHLILLS